MLIRPLLIEVVLITFLAVGATLLIEHSLSGALKAVKFALKSEFTTDTGKLNLIGMILLVFIFIFSDLHDYAANALSNQKPAPAENHVLAPVLMIGLLFVGSLVCVLLVEKNN